MIGKLIVLEGIDGVGKTTLSKELCAILNKQGVPCFRYEDIENKASGFNLLKPFIAESAPLAASFFFYLASSLTKSDHIKKLLQNHWIICDRYIYSTYAAHYARGLKGDLMPPITSLPLLLPDYGFLITVPDPVRIARAHQRSDSMPEDFIENIPGKFPFLFEKELRRHQLIEIDNTTSVSETVDTILKHIHQL